MGRAASFGVFRPQLCRRRFEALGAIGVLSSTGSTPTYSQCTAIKIHDSIRTSLGGGDDALYGMGDFDGCDGGAATNQLANWGPRYRTNDAR